MNRHTRSSKLFDGTEVSVTLLGWNVLNKNTNYPVWGLVLGHRTAPDTLVVFAFNNAKHNNSTAPDAKIRLVRESGAASGRACAPIDYPAGIATPCCQSGPRSASQAGARAA